MKNYLIIIFIICSTASVAQPYTHVLHTDSLFRVNLATGDSVLIPNQSQVFRIVKDSSKNAVTTAAISSALGYIPSASNRYAIGMQALTSSPVDAQTVYFGRLPKAPVTAANTSKIYIRRAGTIKVAEIYCYSGTAGTAEAWTIYIRLNNATDTQIASVSSATNERVFSNTNLSIAVNAGDYIEIKSVNPTWATNPLTCILAGYILIE